MAVFEVLDTPESAGKIAERKVIPFRKGLSVDDAEVVLGALASLVGWRASQPEGPVGGGVESVWEDAIAVLNTYFPPVQLWDVWTDCCCSRRAKRR